jgi:hypothetical protein
VARPGPRAAEILLARAPRCHPDRPRLGHGDGCGVRGARRCCSSSTGVERSARGRHDERRPIRSIPACQYRNSTTSVRVQTLFSIPFGALGMRDERA